MRPRRQAPARSAPFVLRPSGSRLRSPCPLRGGGVRGFRAQRERSRRSSRSSQRTGHDRLDPKRTCDDAKGAALGAPLPVPRRKAIPAPTSSPRKKPTRFARCRSPPLCAQAQTIMGGLEAFAGRQRGCCAQLSISRGINSTILQGLWRLSSCTLMTLSQPSFTAPPDPGKQKTKTPPIRPAQARLCRVESPTV